MAYTIPKIIYNASTGSNSNSGSNAPTTAITDTSTSQTVSGTASSNTLTFSAAVDLTGINDDGTDMIYVDHGLSASDDAYLFQIVSITGSVSACTALTVEPSIGDAGISAAAWAIGGKRQNPEGNNGVNSDFNWSRQGWYYEFESGTYTQSTADWTFASNIDSDVFDSRDTPMVLAAAEGANVVFQPAAAHSGTFMFIEDRSNECSTIIKGITFDASNCTSIAAGSYCLHLAQSSMVIGCTFKGWNDSGNNIIAISGGGLVNGPVMSDCDFQNCYTGIEAFGSYDQGIVRNCRFYSDTLASPEMAIGINTGSSAKNFTIHNCIFSNFSSYAIGAGRVIDEDDINAFTVSNCTIDGGDKTDTNRRGITFGTGTPSYSGFGSYRNASAFVENNVITRCNKAIEFEDDIITLYASHNAFFDNTTNYTNTPVHPLNLIDTSNDVTTDPLFTNNTTGAVADYDYTLQSGSPLIGAAKPFPYEGLINE